LLISNFLICLW